MKIYLRKNTISNQKVLCVISFFSVLLLVFFLIFSFLARFRPVFEEKAVILAKVRATEILNNAVYQVFSGIESEEYVNISKKESGEITQITTDSVKINKLKSKISSAIYEKAGEEKDFYIYIPIGSLTKYPIFQGMGYKIPIKVSFDGYTKTDFKEEFVSAGINQVKNRIYIIANSNISIISSFLTLSSEVSTEVPVVETIVVGDVPEYYGDKLGVVGR